jgi:hypothetical protein
MDCRSEDRKIVGKLRGDIGAIREALTPSFRKPELSPSKKKKNKKKKQKKNRSARRWN